MAPKLRKVDESGCARVHRRGNAVIEAYIRIDAVRAALVPMAMQINQARTQVAASQVNLGGARRRGKSRPQPGNYAPLKRQIAHAVEVL